MRVAEAIYEDIKHGDEDHRRWLKERLEAFYESHPEYLPKTEKPIDALEAAAIDALSSLVAAVSLLQRGGKKAAPSDKMFVQMLIDYNNSIDRTRAVLEFGA